MYTFTGDAIALTELNDFMLSKLITSVSIHNLVTDRRNEVSVLRSGDPRSLHLQFQISDLSEPTSKNLLGLA